MPAAAEPGRALTFHAADGTISIAGLATAIGPSLRADLLPPDLDALVSRRLDHGNGWAWAYMEGFALAGQRCTLALGAFHGHVVQVNWSLTIAGEDYSGGWPSQAASYKEIALGIEFLTGVFGPGPHRDPEGGSGYQRAMPWGVVWCGWDAKGGACSTGLRYERTHS
ncbi:hypothetical protein KDK95_24250 [Actinospica sp. MGRD01-02]|uniref:Uncharacterized protein n=1 Tax=Actinospica acidithermotolerans TaxID=2828514 RepID=A0A941IIA7_9ACTN|nr:hypothetical protein [Actinospica acidithermotolerans]MBR7829440.1 hypothetical protein [Actinospica acidithermotolerans]